MAVRPTIGSVLLDRLHQLGLRHIFGIPGDYVLKLFELIEQSPIRHIATTREDCAGFAADAYARLNGIGAVCVTYCVGGLNVVNAIACAYAERSPVVLLSGSPGVSERRRSPLLHHMVRDFTTQKEVFEQVTAAAVILDDPFTAEREIDRALAALVRYRRPIYIEIPRDLFHAPVEVGTRGRTLEEVQSDPGALAEAVAEVREILASVERPVLLVGAEVQRFGLQAEVARLAERMQIPVASTLLGKSVIREDHPLFIGVYSRLVGADAVQNFVHEADCLLMLGTILTDLEDVTEDSPLMRLGRTIHATADAITIKHHRYEDVLFQDFIRALIDAPLPPIPPTAPPERCLALARTPSGQDPGLAAGTVRTAGAAPGRKDALHRRHWRVVDRGNRSSRSQPQRIHLARLLHHHGVRRPGHRRSWICRALAATTGARRRWRLPDDRHRAEHVHSVWPDAHRRHSQ